MTEDAHATVGWLALLLQGSSDHLGILSSADHVTYTIRDTDRRGFDARLGHHGPIADVTWRGGPLGSTVAARLIETALLSEDAISPGPPRIPEDRGLCEAYGCIIIGNVWVTLHSSDARPDAEPHFVRSRPAWRWPDPLRTDGTARAVVIWQSSPDPDTGLASVLHVPADANPALGYWMVNPVHRLPHSASRDRYELHTQATYDAPVRLHTAARGAALDDARAFVRTELFRLGPRPGIFAVRMPLTVNDYIDGHEKIYLRYWPGPDEPGLDIVADLDEYLPSKGIPDTGDRSPHFSVDERRRGYGPIEEAWTHLAPALLAAAVSPGPMPAHLLLFPLGIGEGARWLFTLSTTLTEPVRSVR